MQDYILNYHRRKIRFVRDVETWASGKTLSPEDLIYLHIGFASDFLGLTATGNSDPSVARFQHLTRSYNQDWGLSWLVFLINDGVAKTLSDMAESYVFPSILPARSYVDAFLEWSKKYQTHFPSSGDLIIVKRDELDYDAGVVTEVNMKAKKVTSIDANVKPRGKKEYGVFEVSRTLPKVKGEVFFIDMLLVYKDFLQEARRLAVAHDEYAEGTSARS